MAPLHDMHPAQENPEQSVTPQINESNRQAFLDSLRKTPGLYDLTRSEFENLVYEVVKEPGFRLVKLYDIHLP